MSNIAGTNVAAAVRPFTTDDQYAVAVANEIQGGRHSVATLVARNAIFKARRVIGMQCYVEETQKTYELKTDAGNAATLDTDWAIALVDPANIVLDGGKTLPETLTEIDSKTTANVVFAIDPVKVGINAWEFPIPHVKGVKVKSITANVPRAETLTKDISLAVEKFDTAASNWVVIDSLSILKTESSKSKTLTTPVDLVQFDRIRVNVLDCQDGLKNLVVIATIIVN